MDTPDLEIVAGGGLISSPMVSRADRRRRRLALLRAQPAVGCPADVPTWMKAPGQPLRPYGERSPHEDPVQAHRLPCALARPEADRQGRRSSRSRASSRRARCTSSAVTAASPTFHPISIAC